MFENKKNNVSLPGSTGQSINKEEIVGSSLTMTFVNKILIGLTAFLAVIYFLSFTKSCSSADKRENVKTALLNQKYKDSISSFEFQDASGKLTIINKGSFWAICDSEGNEILPASSERLENLINNLTTIRNLYKISDKINQNSTFGLTNGTEFHLRYYTENGFHELIFGNQDFSLSSRYMMTEKSTQVYEIDSSLDSYLSSSIQNWSEPTIISQLVLGKIKAEDVQRSPVSDVQKLLDLRHCGAVTEDTQNLSQPLIQFTLELGNKNEIELEIYNSAKENEYVVVTEYKTQKVLSRSSHQNQKSAAGLTTKSKKLHYK